MSAASGEPEVTSTLDVMREFGWIQAHAVGDEVDVAENMADEIIALRARVREVEGEREAAIREMAKARNIATKHAGDADLLWLILEDQKESGRGGLLPKVHARARKAERDNESLRARLAACDGERDHFRAVLDWIDDNVGLKEQYDSKYSAPTSAFFGVVEGFHGSLEDAANEYLDGHARTVRRSAQKEDKA